MSEKGTAGLTARRGLLRFGVVCASFLAALLLGALLLLLQGENPLEIYYYMFVSPLSSASGLIKVLGKATPLVFSGLAIAVAFKCSVFNIGVEGQLYVGGLVAAVLGVVVKGLPAVLHVAVCILGAMVAGALVALVPAVLKVKFNVHEVISTIMLNYVISALISLVVVSYFRSGGEHARTPTVLDSARLYQFTPPEHFNAGIVLALVLCAAVWLMFKKTPLGWRIDAAGKNLQAARYSGINSGRLVIVAMMMSGAIAALVGVERVLGAYGYMELNFSPGFGYDGIAIAIIAGNNPIGVLVVAFIMGLMSHGGLMVNIKTSVPNEWASVLIGIIFILVVAGNAFIAMLERRERKLPGQRGRVAEEGGK